MFYVPSSGSTPKSTENSSDNGDGHGLAHLSPISTGLIAFQKKKGVGAALLTITVVEGRNLPVMDPNGKSDPYCIVAVGDQEQRTAVQYNTINPEWRETLQFEVAGVPQLMQIDGDETSANWCMVHYIQIEVWDRDTLNRDDFMGRLMIPVSALSERQRNGWYPLGRATPKDGVTGEMYLEIALIAKQPVPRWNVDYELHALCKKRPGFELAFESGASILDFPGDAEHVEMVLDDVVVEISKHRGIGRVYLTDFRLVILCNSSGNHAIGHCDMSMWIALNNIQSVEKGEDEKVVRRDVGGSAAFAEVKTLTIRCWDFRTIFLTFMSSNQPMQSLFVQLPEPASSQSSPDSVPESAHVLQEQQRGETRESRQTLDSICPVDDIRSGADTEDLTRSSSHSSFRVLSHSSSSGSADGIMSHPEGLLGVPQRPTLGPDITNVLSLAGMVAESSIMTESGVSKLRNDNFIANFLPFYVIVLWQRLEYIILNSVDNPPSKAFVTSDLQLNGWDVYNCEDEFTRQKVSSKWRLSRANLDFTVCRSYPKFNYIPAEIEDETLRSCSHFRCKGRFPALSWYNAKKENFIMRCAQPKTGARGKISTEDEEVVSRARLSNTTSERLVIFDARSMMAAGGNMLMGKGTEDTLNRYQGCSLVFLDIPNIHAVRDSLDRLQAVCESSSQKKWLSHLESTQWLAYIAAILKGATTIARFVDKGVSTLVHCSDGWDRTSQLTSLAQLLLDPYYRTFTGFQVLIEKEWISFGHRFRDRLGHPTCPSQRSPIFLQFLDCVWQVHKQFPSAFQFTANYLLKLADHVNSQWFGNFLYNNVQERHHAFITRTTVSLWSHLNAVKDNYTNSIYQPTEMLVPVSSLRRLQLWSDYFLRYDETAWTPIDPGDDMDDVTTSPSGVVPKPPTDTVVWVPDERVKECHDCKQRFTRFKRKHHCRACGQVFCGDCSKQRVPLPQFGYTSAERVCETCYQLNRVRMAEEEGFVEINNLGDIPERSARLGNDDADENDADDGDENDAESSSDEHFYPHAALLFAGCLS
ncbi:uncharacterized protein LOC5520963 isoform X2 [Nematostella vectensis]|uniref:uncharacterized protein LOC5520963 isoform X2 n=1 Tax=Nematostella vectensis TaxID=45351 RepID=UPI002077292C|nr:uncharacterized protein LOC5520963 isoform X2 [Nematostella vectensis]